MLIGYPGFTEYWYIIIQTANPSLYNRKFKLDAAIKYEYITPEMLSMITKEEKSWIYEVTNLHCNRSLIEPILETYDADRLHDLILHSETPELQKLRGTLAEIFVLTDLGTSCPETMTTYRNAPINLFNKKYREGTEIDGFLR